MRKLQVGFAAFVLSFFACQSSQAAVLDVDVTVKSVDAKSRGITVVYGEKVIELDVSRKAAITVNGKESSLDAVLPGQKAQITYEKDLQVVTKIDAKGKGVPAGPEVCRFLLSISEFGDCILKVEQTKTPISSAMKFEGESVKLAYMPKAEALKAADGSFCITHSFDNCDDLASLFTMLQNVELDKQAGTLAFTSGKNRIAAATYRSFVQLPVVICYDRRPIQTKTGIAIQLIFVPGIGMLHVNVGRNKNDDTTVTSAFWVDGKETHKRTDLLNGVPFDLKEGTERKFRLPLPNARIEENCRFGFATWGDDGKKSELRHLVIQGHLHPMLGIGLEQRKEVIFVQSVTPLSFADNAGIKAGDVIVSINDQQPKSRQEALDLCCKLKIGEVARLKIRRGDKEADVIIDFK